MKDLHSPTRCDTIYLMSNTQTLTASERKDLTLTLDHHVGVVSRLDNGGHNFKVYFDAIELVPSFVLRHFIVLINDELLSDEVVPSADRVSALRSIRAMAASTIDRRNS